MGVCQATEGGTQRCEIAWGAEGPSAQDHGVCLGEGWQVRPGEREAPHWRVFIAELRSLYVNLNAMGLTKVF